MNPLSLTAFLNKYWTLLLIAGLIFYIVYSGNKTDNLTINNDRIDSILRILNTPEKTGTFKDKSPQPTIIIVPQPGSTTPGMSNDMLRAFEELKNDNAKTRAYAEAIARKAYSKTYSDSTVSITVKDVVEGGVLKDQQVDWVVKAQEMQYFENIYYMKPKFTINAGLKIGTAIGPYGYNSTQLLPTLGYKGRNGWGFEASINILNTKHFQIGATKDIFTKYEKIPEKK